MFRIPTAFRLTVAFAAAAFGSVGCHNFPKHTSTHAEDAEHSAEPEPGPDTPLDVKSTTPKPFFKSSRLSGALSDEGREIERDLGIH